ncbi:MAG: DUF2769 domain-containing protein [Candidatus Diapherotrites archaeon]|nr:DUF2769 domain-containing protein [Candidatus Diapherotrites archaeon]
MQVSDSPVNAAKCLCAKCPSFAGLPGFYCARGRARGKVICAGCKCRECAVFNENSLTDEYYCDHGEEGVEAVLKSVRKQKAEWEAGAATDETPAPADPEKKG